MLLRNRRRKNYQRPIGQIFVDQNLLVDCPAVRFHFGCVFCGKCTLTSQYGSSILVPHNDFWVNRFAGTLHDEISQSARVALTCCPGVFFCVDGITYRQRFGLLGVSFPKSARSENVFMIGKCRSLRCVTHRER